ncbi:MAG: hypothetical protein IPG61_02130 [bacterium]|nr:hypothetical protein [bacterium]
MNKAFLLVLFLVVSSAAFAEDEWCLTPTSSVDPLKSLGVSHPYPHEMNSAVFRIFIHLLRRSDGTGGITSQQADEQLEWLFNGMAPYGVSFVEIGRDEILYRYFDSIFYNQIPLRVYDRTDAVDIFLGDPAPVDPNGNLEFPWFHRHLTSHAS